MKCSNCGIDPALFVAELVALLQKLREARKLSLPPSGKFWPDTSNYRLETIIQTEKSLSQKEVDELSDKALERTIGEFKKITSGTETPQEKYKVTHEPLTKSRKEWLRLETSWKMTSQ